MRGQWSWSAVPQFHSSPSNVKRICRELRGAALISKFHIRIFKEYVVLIATRAHSALHFAMESPLQTIPPEILYHIASMLDLKSVLHLAASLYHHETVVACIEDRVPGSSFAELFLIQRQYPDIVPNYLIENNIWPSWLNWCREFPRHKLKWIEFIKRVTLAKLDKYSNSPERYTPLETDFDNMFLTYLFNLS